MPSLSPPVVELWSAQADAAVWNAVTRLFVEAFSAPPYDEDPGRLGEIAVWGPELLATPGGTLAVATQDSAILGFGLGRTLSSDAGWQRLLRRCDTAETTSLADAADDVFVIQELATAAAARRRGVAELCLTRLLESRCEAHVVLGVYAQAEPAQRFYARLGYRVLGNVTIDGGQRLDVLTR
ncbi:GNAT family N-acetyltransferase [Microbacterium hibisci]|uniref:GNAT family N-acetyltransferase n=1 Tax=Microbacterium hibisci TaxID=2036000 RepID=UPI001944174A|nr:GNAT family N-acetyltransferase [Microbacterium hibisci]